MKPTKKAKTKRPPVEIELDRRDQLTGLRILIVEDMGLIAAELELLLETLDCHVVGVASRLSEAVKLASTTKHLDGVLLDLNLSGEQSYPVAEILHKRGIPFIIMSGYDAGDTRADCKGDAHLQKPFGNDDVTNMMLRTFLPRKDVRKNEKRANKRTGRDDQSDAPPANTRASTRGDRYPGDRRQRHATEGTCPSCRASEGSARLSHD